MTTAILFKKCDSLWNTLQERTELLQREQRPFLETTESLLMEADEALRQLKSWIQDHDFENWETEIRFFKTIKPKFTAPFIYHSKLLSIEAARPYADDAALKLYYEKELTALHYYFTAHQEFISYYRRNATYLDRKYFLRYQYDLKVHISPDFHNYDHRFSTSHDMVVASILAYDQLEQLLKNKIKGLDTDHSFSMGKMKTLHWTGTKSALTELLAALHYTQCFNGGRTEFSEVVRWAEASLNIDLGNYHKTIGELRARKNDRTKFLNMLVESLNKHFTDLDA